MFKFSLNFYGVYRLFRLKYLKKQRVRFCPKMSNEVKLRKKSHSAKSNNLSESPKANGEEKERRSGGRLEAEEVGKERSSGVRLGEPSGSSLLDLRTCLCFLTLAVCGALAWVVLQQNERFSDLENKYTLLHQRTTGLLTLEEEVLRVSEKLSSSQEGLRGALASAATATRLQTDLAALRAVVTAIQADEDAASLALQAVNAHFLNVTELWAGRMASATSDLAGLKAEARAAHAGATESVNEAERRGRALGERLDELADSSARNVRAMERAEEADVVRARGQLDWNTAQLLGLGGRVGDLARRGEELAAALREHVPRARACEEQLPAVEEAVRSILRLGAALSGAEGRLEELTLTVLGTEDGLLRTLGDMVALRGEVDALQARGSVRRMKEELEVVKEAVQELTMVLREGRGEAEGGGLWGEEEEEEEEEEWIDYDEEDPPDLVLGGDLSD
ncbi:inhibitor of nuclear factor kappa-B kinase-interacting protein isoform X1 [Gadus chalcogrammus]|uniref:inhibitor of nuclear factor kappa-B kinase-interacting protein isoform X1 n=2 Tax=Gadus chalcogrammus TaxID=1042646 RepID=UPI0024C4B5CE|nr:inhibitor of nuclear factor kappa-B kinase-interacting protein isoform X1 [Gadus chalcogrammus]